MNEIRVILFASYDSLEDNINYINFLYFNNFCGMIDTKFQYIFIIRFFCLSQKFRLEEAKVAIIDVYECMSSVNMEEMYKDDHKFRNI